MNIQLKRFGKDLIGFAPSVPNRDFVAIPEIFSGAVQSSAKQPEKIVRVRIYHNRTDKQPESFILSVVDLTEWVIIHEGQRYQCADSRRTNSEFFRTIITPLNEKDPDIDLGAHNAWA